MRAGNRRELEVWVWASVAILTFARPALAYRTLADDPEQGLTEPAAWSGPIMWDLHTGDLGPARVSELERRAVAAFGAWSMPICTEFTADYRGLSSPAASGDGRNTISVVSSGWVEVFGFAAGRAATTDVRAEVDETGHGRIVEADIYLNFEEFTFGLSESSGLDATAVLLHEIGHLAGLLHPCGDSGAPACSSEAVFAQSVLHPDTTPSSPRTLSSDDEAGICALYPSRPITCEPACGPREMCFGGCAALAHPPNAAIVTVACV